jgi:hypothetical protein
VRLFAGAVCGSSSAAGALRRFSAGASDGTAEAARGPGEQRLDDACGGRRDTSVPARVQGLFNVRVQGLSIDFKARPSRGDEWDRVSRSATVGGAQLRQEVREVSSRHP